MLEQLGVDVVFGIPGNHTAELYRGLSQTSIRHITTRHEQGAAFMADGYARVQGRPGVCFLISGPGLLNAATGITQAQQDGVPLLVITTCTSSPGANTGLHEMPDQDAVAAGLGKAFYKLTAPSQLARTLLQAYETCLTPSPGAVILQIPEVLLDRVVTSISIRQAKPQTTDLTPRKYSQLIRPLARAKRPLILVGGGAQWTDPLQVAKLADVLDAPVVNTVNGKGVVPIDHPLAVGGSPSLPCLKRALAKADVVLALGTQLSETDYDLLMDNTPAPAGRWLHVNTATTLPRGTTQSDVFCAPVDPVVTTLLNTLAQHRRRGRQRAAQLRKQVLQEPHYHQDFVQVFNAISQAADDLVLVGDSTRPTYYAAWMYECRKPRRYFHSASGFGTLGYAIPAAMGARLASDVPVVALIGDGGAQFSFPELATAVDNQIGVPIIIWQNQGYEEITNSLKARGVGASSTEVSAPDYRKVAEAYGIGCISPRSIEGLTRAIRQTLTDNQPSLILVDQQRFVHSPSGEWYG